PKSEAGTRTVPIAAVLRDHLIAPKLRCGWSDGLVFGRQADLPFDPGGLPERAATARARAAAERRGGGPRGEAVGPLNLHECRHTFASLMIAAGVNAKALSTYMGHSSVTITYDRYGHLMPGAESEAGSLLDAYLERANTKARLAQIGDVS